MFYRSLKYQNEIKYQLFNLLKKVKMENNQYARVGRVFSSQNINITDKDNILSVKNNLVNELINHNNKSLL
jgi:hypothetical protein